MKRVVLASLVLALVSADAAASGYSDFNAGIQARGRDPEAEVRYFTAALADPGLLANLRGVALLDRGDAYLTQKQFGAAVADYNASLALRSDFEAVSHRGIANYGLGRHDLAMADFTAAIAMNPEVPMGYSLRFNLEMEDGRLAGAIADSTAIIAVDPTSTAYILRSTAHRLAGEWDAAMTDADTAIALNRSAPVTYYNKATIFEAQGRFADAIEQVQAGIVYEPHAALSVLRRGILQWEWGRFDDARETFSRAAVLDPKNGYVFLWLAIGRAAPHDGATRPAAADNAPHPAAATDDAQHATGNDVAQQSISEQATTGSPLQHVGVPDTSSWPGPLVKLYSGSLQPAAVMREAQTDIFTVKGRVCEAEFYTAQWQLMRGNAGEGKRLLASAARDCPYGFVEGPVAVNQLKALP